MESLMKIRRPYHLSVFQRCNLLNRIFKKLYSYYYIQEMYSSVGETFRSCCEITIIRRPPKRCHIFCYLLKPRMDEVKNEKSESSPGMIQTGKILNI